MWVTVIVVAKLDLSPGRDHVPAWNSAWQAIPYKDTEGREKNHLHDNHDTPPQMGYEGVTGFPFPGYKLATETYRVSVRKTRVETRVASGSRQITSSLGPRAAA